jgi:hypothetical protein
MSDAIYKKIKKQNGEKFAQTIRNHHNGLLEIPELPHILRYAGRDPNDAEGLLPYLMTLISPKDSSSSQGNRNPFELLDEAGYNAFHANTLAKQNSIKHYFIPEEFLCTFNDAARYTKYHIVHAVKKDVDQIKRDDFKGKEDREDEYSTSVISIQMAKKGGFISIKSRYNHTVSNCDNTLESNPNNIIGGLSAALKKHFDVDFTTSEAPLPEYFALVGGQIVKYHMEEGDVYFGEKFWATAGTVHTFDRGRGDALFDGFLFRNETKKLERIGFYHNDSFAENFNEYYGGNRDLKVDKDGNLTLNGDVLIGAEKSRITSLYLPAFKHMDNNCLKEVSELRTIDAPALKSMNLDALRFAPSLVSANLPALERMEEGNLSNVRSLTNLTISSLIYIGPHSLHNLTSLTTFYAPSLEATGKLSLKNLPSMISVDVPKLRKTNDNCFYEVPNLVTFNAPNVTKLGKSNLSIAQSLATIHVPALETVGDFFLYVTDALEVFDAPSLKEISNECFSTASALITINTPSVERIGFGCFNDVERLTKFHMPSLKVMQNHCLKNAINLNELYVPRLRTSLEYCLQNSPYKQQPARNGRPKVSIK